MKKISIIAILLIANLGIYLHAQEGGLHIGAKAGFNRSNVYDESGDGFVADAKYGFAFGGFLTIPLGPVIGLQPEVLYSEKGFTGSGRFLGGTYNFTRTSTFIDVPLYLQLKIAPSVSILLGPQFSFLTKTKDVFHDGSISIDQENDFSNDNLRKNILGASGGLDIYFSQLVISARVAWDLQQNNGDGTSDKPRYRNVLMQLTAGVAF
ncbi:MAG TPA: porin family protein [Saprospiraceae bacterium]|nr:porin family protein [Saprospiraceae bacterium]